MRAQQVSGTTLAAIETWARQRRAILDTSAPVASTLGRIRDERVAAGEGDLRLRQKWGEVFRGDGLLVSIAVRTLQETPRLVVTFHHTLRPWRVPIADQVRELGIARSEYWRALQIGEASIDSALQVMTSAREWAPAAGLRLAA